MKINPRIYNDELALKTDWDILLGVISSGNENDQVSISNGALIIYSSSKINAYRFFVILGFIISALPFIFKEQLGNDWWVITAFGLFLFLISLFMELRRSEHYFDKNNDKYFLRRIITRKIINSSVGRIGNIHAIQLLKYRDAGTSTEHSDSYIRFQLNLVLKDGSRSKVLESRDGDLVNKLGTQLSEFLSINIWDASDVLCGVI